MIPVLILSVTNHCNSNCKYCWLSNSELKTTTQELTQAELKAIIANTPKIGIAIITGGEPFLRTDLYETVMQLSKKTKRVVITTNGIETKRIKDFLEELPKRINFQITFAFSIDGPEKHHNKIKNSSVAYQNMMRSYQLIRISGHTSLKTSFAFTYTRTNQPYLPVTISFLKNDLKPDSITITFPRGDIPKDELSNLDIQKYLKYSAEIRKYNNISSILKIGKPIGNIIDRIKRDIISRLYLNKSVPFIRCKAGKKVVVLLPNGDIPICELRSQMLGNIRDFDYNLSKLLKGEKAKKIMEQINKNNCICTHECFLGPSIPVNLPQIIRFYFYSIFSSKL